MAIYGACPVRYNAGPVDEIRVRSTAMELVKEVLDILACPKCKGPLRVSEGHLVCTACRLKYPVRDGIPVLLVEESIKLSEE